MDCEVCGTPLAEVRISRNRLSSRRRCDGCRLVGRAYAKKHGHSAGGHTPEYATWHGMLQRCENPNCRNFPNYGGRGITVCESWHDFTNFLADMGPRPDGLSLDRIDVNGGYSPENCRWISHKKQMQNLRKTLWVTYKGEKMSLQELADKLGIDRYTLRRRVLGLKWPEEHWADPPKKVHRRFHPWGSLTVHGQRPKN